MYKSGHFYQLQPFLSRGCRSDQMIICITMDTKGHKCDILFKGSVCASLKYSYHIKLYVMPINFSFYDVAICYSARIFSVLWKSLASFLGVNILLFMSN